MAAAAATGVVATLLAAPPSAGTEGATVARRYHDGLDSRLSAVRLGRVARDIGYDTTIARRGRSADDAFLDGSRSAVLGLFGHSHAGVFQTDEGASNATDALLSAGTPTDVASPYAHVRFLHEYVPYVEVDDMRLLVLAGCYTSRSSASWGDFDQAAVSRGVDSVVTFPGLVFYPDTAAGTRLWDTNYSGNYFWSRFAYHVKRRATTAAALKRAFSDLLAKEGRGGGWGRYRIDGSVDRPGEVQLKPAGWGELFTSQPGESAGVRPYDSLEQLTVTAHTPASGPDGAHSLVTTEEGVDYRLRADGSLLDVTAATASAGPIRLGADQARAVAEAFAERYVDAFDDSWRLVEQQATSHVDGDALTRLTWRPAHTDRPGPGAVVAEVDRRTGALTYFAAPRARAAANADFTLTEQQAIDVAREATGIDDGTVTAVADSWHTSRWTVTFDRGTREAGPAAVPHTERVVVDARTGRLLAHTTT